MILAGDIGGTNTRLALFDEYFMPVGEPMIYKNAGRDSFVEMVREYLAQNLDGSLGRIMRACFGVAGPVSAGRVALTNLNWQLDEMSLSEQLGVSKLALINDLVANAEGVERLQPQHLVPLNDGMAVHGGTRAVIAAGTGLGEAGLVWDRHRSSYHALPSEGGHADFAPIDDREIALLHFMRSRVEHVSWESVLSGPGLRNVYDFIISPGQLGPSAAMESSDPTPAEISDVGSSGSNAGATAALELFVALYGAEAGNLALKLLATGGVYVGGGIAPKILDLLQSNVFLDRFNGKGPAKLHEVLKKIPIYVINFELCALYGAANYASRL